jgi:hypothetical protein
VQSDTIPLWIAAGVVTDPVADGTVAFAALVVVVEAAVRTEV